MRIAIFTEVFAPKVDGITNRLSYTLRCMRTAGHEVLVFAPAGSVSGYEGFRVVGVPGLPFPPYPQLRITAPDPRIAWELRRFRPDVVHAVGPACLGIWGMIAARQLGLPLVASYHTDLPRYAPQHGLAFAQKAMWPLIRRVHNLALLNFTPSRATQEELEAHGIERVERWRGGVDTERFRPERRNRFMRSQLMRGASDGPLLLYAGRLSPEKRLDTLVPLIDALQDSACGAHLALVGDGPDRARLEHRFRGRPVTFTGFLHGEHLAAAFASADLFVMPSTTETLGFVVLEAMSSGCPVLAANAGGLRELVADGENGLLYDPDDEASLIDTARDLLDDPARRRYLAVQGRKTAEGCRWQDETRDLVWRYRGAIERHRRSSPLARLRYRALL